MRQTLVTDTGRARYALRKITIEPICGQIKHNRGVTRVYAKRRSRRPIRVALVSAAHNLLKLHSHRTAVTA
jgi:hypothetical protein